MSHRAPAGNDDAVIAHSDPSAGHLLTVGVQREVHGSLRSDGLVIRCIPAHQNFVVPDTKLAPPVIATLLNRKTARNRFERQQISLLGDPDFLRSDNFCSVLERLPCRPPFTAA